VSRLRWAGPAVLALAVALYVAQFTHWHTYVGQVDLMVYRFGGQRVLDGRDLYARGLFGSARYLLFTYTPFAAVFFTPLTWLPLPWLRGLWLALGAALVVFAVDRTLVARGVPARRWALTALLTGLCLWLEPVRYSLELGQINLLILAAAVADLLVWPHRRWAGVALGVAAGIKLTPAILLLFLLLIGRRRAALVGFATAIATVGVGFAVLPAASRFYWLSGNYAAAQRISPDTSLGTSIRGVFLREHWPLPLAAGLSLAVAAVGLALAVLAWRRGEAALAIALAGSTGAAASPFSWSHHWVWFVPLLVHLGRRWWVEGSRTSAVVLAALWAVLAAWPVAWRGRAPAAGLVRLPGFGWVYVAVFGVVLVVSAAGLLSSRRRAARIGSGIGTAVREERSTNTCTK
jgi:alpha-1,2-mannosyltransferase